MTSVSYWKRALMLALSVAAISLLAFSFACGDDDDGGNGDDDNGDGEPVSFDVSMGDNFFEPAEFTVPAGAKVTFNLTNDGAAIHNMRVSGEDGEYNTDDDAVSDPDLMTAGSEATLEWTAPDEEGEIPFNCDFHPTDMIGTITVE